MVVTMIGIFWGCPRQGDAHFYVQGLTKGFDEKVGLLAKAQLQIQALETQLAAMKPKKRKRVETSPDSRFVDIEAVRRAQAEVNAAENEDSYGTEDELSEVVDDCIVAGVGGR